jgi:hypothetical protein
MSFDKILPKHRVISHPERDNADCFERLMQACFLTDPRYILDLLLSIINVSLQTVDIVEALPNMTFESGV